MSLSLYTKTSLDLSKKLTQAYSTSFTLGIKTLHPKLHAPIYGIYGFVRLADEIVDTFHEHPKEQMLQEFKDETYRSINQKLSLNPILQSFQEVVNSYGIDHSHIEAFFKSMEMDLDRKNYNDRLYEEYIYGSAEVVGLMCLRVFCEGDEKKYNQLENSAKHLGSAFQKVNFLRDLKSDYEDRGRVYFPGIQYDYFDNQAKQQIVDSIQNDFDIALQGIKKLPRSSRLGVYLAYVYYLKLLHKIKQTPAATIKSERIRVPDGRKLFLLAQSMVRNRLNLIR